MATKSLFFPPSAADKTPVLTEEPLSAEEVTGSLHGPECGAVVTFQGRVRGSENWTTIRSITYEAYKDMAVRLIRNIVLEAEKRWNVRVAVSHRIGEVPVGEASVIVACAGAHRNEAFLACQNVIDEIKERVPIWKVEFERSGS